MKEKVFALKSVGSLGLEPLQLNVSKKVVNLIKQQYLTEFEYRIVIGEIAESVNYVAIDNEFYSTKIINGKLIKEDPLKFVQEEGPYHILLGNELEWALSIENHIMKGDSLEYESFSTC